MIDEIQKMMDGYVSWLREKTSLREIGDWVEITTPMLDRHNDYLQMAADTGLVRTDEDVISAGGTAQGVDSALVLKPANSARFFDLKVREVICKPAVF